VNVKYFSSLGLYGLAGSPITDSIVAPKLSCFILLVVAYLIYKYKNIKEIVINSQLGAICIIFILSGMIYILRWGYISTATFIASFVIWCIIPIIGMYKLLSNSK
jgi:hypothetical protein